MGTLAMLESLRAVAGIVGVTLIKQYCPSVLT